MLQPRSLSRGPFPKADLAALAQAIVNQPIRIVVRPLLISAALRPGESITIAAGDLPTSPPHDVLFVLQGPGLRAQQLVQVSNGIATGIVTVPASLSPGTWVLAAVDLSQIHATGRGRPSGIAQLDMAVFQVS